MLGVINLDKPVGPTSHDMVGLVRRLTGMRRIGHAGTLDPLASGVLPIMVGGATRLSQELTGGRKRYDAGRLRKSFETHLSRGTGADKERHLRGCGVGPDPSERDYGRQCEQNFLKSSHRFFSFVFSSVSRSDLVIG